MSAGPALVATPSSERSSSCNSRTCMSDSVGCAFFIWLCADQAIKLALNSKTYPNLLHVGIEPVHLVLRVRRRGKVVQQLPA